MKFLVDIGVSKAVEEWMREAGYDVLGVRDIDPKASDSEILSIAVSEQRIIITMDKDFGELVYHSGQKHAGVLILRIEDARRSEKIQVVKYILSNYAHQLQGNFSVYQHGRLRIRQT